VLCKQEVVGSILSGSTITKPKHSFKNRPSALTGWGLFFCGVIGLFVLIDFFWPNMPTDCDRLTDCDRPPIGKELGETHDVCDITGKGGR